MSKAASTQTLALWAVGLGVVLYLLYQQSQQNQTDFGILPQYQGSW